MVVLMKIKGTNRKLKVNANSLEDNSKGIFLKISKVGSCTRYMKNVWLHDVVNHFDFGSNKRPATILSYNIHKPITPKRACPLKGIS